MNQSTQTSKLGVATLSNRTVAQLLLEYLKLEGARKIFGIPGGALISLLNELRQQQAELQFFVCRHETGAAYIAHGYARVSGQLGVVMTTSGPAATNALTGVMNAQASNCELLSITGEIAQQYFGRGFLQEGIDASLDVNAIFRNAVQYSAVVTSQSNFSTLFQQALRVARSQPPRAAHISLPNDVAAQTVLGPDKADPQRISFPTSPTNYRTVPRSTDVTAAQETLAALARAKRPLIFLGNGARSALQDCERMRRFTAMVERFGLPVMTTPDAKGIFPESHQWSLRNYGLTGCSWPSKYIQSTDYDVLLVLGSSLGELATSVVETDDYSKNLVPSEQFVQVDLDQSAIGRSFPITRGIVGDVGATLDAMWAHAAAHSPGDVAGRSQLLADLKASVSPFADPKGRASDAAPIHPAALVRVMNESIRSGHIFIDAGNCVGWSLNNLVIDPPVSYQSALDMGPMGFGVGAVIGGKIAAPDEVCVALVGDGAFMMHGAEVSTAAQYGIGAVWVVLYDDDLGMVSQGMGGLFPPATNWNECYALGRPDLVKFSEGLGAEAQRVGPEHGPKEFRAALALAIERATTQRRPQVIVAHIDRKPQPAYGWQPIHGGNR